MNDRLSILFYIEILKKYYKKIILLIILSIGTTILYIYFKKPLYTSQVSILLEGMPNIISPFSNKSGFYKYYLYQPGVNTIISIINSKRMMHDIYLEFADDLKKDPDLYFRLEAFNTFKGILLIRVRASDPALASEIANFCVENLDTINAELNITPQRPMVKVLDRAFPASEPDPKYILKRVLLASIFGFVIGNFFAFIVEYNNYLNNIRKGTIYTC